MKQSAQGALEYLLLIGGAVLVAGIVIVLILGVSSSGQSGTNSSLDTINEAKAAQGVDTSMVVNASFERPLGSEWVSNGGTWNIVSNSSDPNANCPNGTNCLKISTSVSCDGIYQLIPISPDTAYYASAYVRGNCMPHAHLLNPTCSNGYYNITWFAGNPLGSSTWQKVSATIRVNSSDNSVTITNSSGTTTTPMSSQSCTNANQTNTIRLYLIDCSGFPVTGHDYCDMVTFRKN